MIRLLLLTFLIMGCQQNPSATAGTRVRLQFPQGLKTPSARWERFLRRVIQLEITVKGEGTPARRIAAGPLAWSSISLDDWQPPASGSSEIEAKVWDRNEEGLPRTYPVAIGKTKITAAQWAAGEEVALRISLQVSVKDFD